MYDILIVGAGPAGNHLAGSLAGKGCRVLVLEKNAAVGKATCCTGIVGKTCLCDLTPPAGIVARDASGATFFAPSGNDLRLSRSTVEAHILDRHRFDGWMASRAAGRGAEYLLNARVSNFDIDRNGVSVEARINGDQVRFRTAALALAGGFRSRLLTKLGITAFPDFVMGAQAEVETDADEIEVHFGSHIAPGFFAWLVPTAEGRGLAGLLTRNSTSLYMRHFLKQLERSGRVRSSDVPVKFGGIPLSPLHRTYGERTVILGDSAGQVKPTTGGGIYYALQCAEVASETLLYALDHDDFRGVTLARYDRKWKRLLSREIRIGRWARRAFERLDNSQIDGLFALARSKGIPEWVETYRDFSFDRHGTMVLGAARHLGASGNLALAGIITASWLRRTQPSPGTSLPRLSGLPPPTC